MEAMMVLETQVAASTIGCTRFQLTQQELSAPRVTFVSI
jgi:hypothetical protein